MARTARKMSATNIYHVMLRGINRQDIFEEDEDRYYFMTVLSQCKKISGFRLHAFVLMSNHIHLLIEPSDETLDMVFRRVSTRYAMWYNRKYQRAGHLFQDRFRSEEVETEQYYKTVLRYILQNPMKAGLESQPGNYQWSSYRAYEKGKGILTDTEFAFDVFGNRENLIGFVSEDNSDSVMDEEDYDWRLRDDAAKEIMRRISHCSSAPEFQLLSLAERKDYVRKLYTEGLSMGQIARLTGMAKTTIFRSVNKDKADFHEEKGFDLQEPEMIQYFMNEETVW